MILPTIRASFSRRDVLHLVQLLGRGDDELRRGAELRLDEEGADAILDDPRVLNTLLTDPDASAPTDLVFYVLVRHALLEVGIDDRATADYVASLVVAFGSQGRAYRPSDATPEEYHYLVDMVARLASADQREAFLLRSHLGNYSLWLSGLFPDYLAARVHRRGAPDLRYYERMGVTGYHLASRSPEAKSLGVDRILHDVGEHFSGVRTALNLVSDRYLWPHAGDPVGRLLREVTIRPGDDAS
ncbi:MAG: hypothetical protein OEO79_09780 [Gemmatimonadota bacterium]|nr:hypothetical protein [Gemmatimonadota bacterium]MDH3421387.1 hypothetical protein [Gemmatimonadota bacterium]